jgi:hemin uptake protein HemP
MNEAPTLSSPEPRLIPAHGDCVRSEDLMDQRTILKIQHGAEHYILRLTKANKLILTK